MSSKGPTFEREICKKLSLWWSRGLDEEEESDAYFWRTSNSGGRASIRCKGGLRTFGQYGDIAATDPKGQKFLDFVTVELKRGYSKVTPYDLVDRPLKSAIQGFEEWIAQAVLAHKRAKSVSWLLITKRDKRSMMAFTPWDLVESLREVGCFHPYPCPMLRVLCKVRLGFDKFVKDEVVDVVGMPLERWLDEVTPNAVKKVLKLESFP